MSNWQHPQQWGAPQGNFQGQPQQNQGWGQGVGQWQQAPPPGQGFYNPQQQYHQGFPPNQGGVGGGGFMTGQAGGHGGGFQAGGSWIPPGGMSQQQHFTGFPQQQQQQQQQFEAMQRQQQQQQMAYMQEQQRLAREEQKKRDIEIQKRKLMNINVANPSASSLSFDDLIPVKPSSSPHSSPKVNRQGQAVPASKTTANIASSSITASAKLTVSVLSDPLPTLSSSTVATKSTGSTSVAGGSAQAPPTTSAQPDKTFEKLMESSLTNIRDVSPASVRKADFKPSTSSAKPPNLLAQQQKTFAESMKARAWGGDDFSGMFAQHMATQQQGEGAVEGDDSFGEFQSVGGTGPGPLPAMTGPPSQPGSHVQPPFAHPGQQPNSAHVTGDLASQQVRSRGGSVHGGNTVPTSAYQHPISSTSVAQENKPLSPTHFSNLDPSKFPPLYITVFQRCCIPGEPYLNTELLFPLLMSSQLPKSTLRDLWNVANREVPGKLNQTELFVLLGLIALAQSGNPSPTPRDLKDAPSLLVPRLSALEEAVPSAGTTAPTLVPPKALPPSQAQPLPPAAPPPSVDDFGNFQQGQGSAFQPSFPPPVNVPSTSQLLAPVAPASGQPSLSNSSSTSDKYGAFDELNVASAGLLTATASLTSGSSTVSKPDKPLTGDKYSVFDDLRVSSSGDASLLSSSDLMTSSQLASGLPTSSQPLQGLLPLATTGAQPLVGNQLVQGGHTPSVSATKTDEFGSFSSAPPPSSAASSQQSMGSSLDAPLASLPPIGGGKDGFADFASFQSTPSGGGLTADNTGQEGWAAFGEFTSSQGTSSNQGVLLPLSASNAPAMSSSSSVATKSKAESAFDFLVPPELLPSTTSKPSEPSSTGSKSPVLPKSAAVPVSSTSMGLQDFAEFETGQLSPQSKKKKEIKKQLTGLEVLEEEFSARVSAKAASSIAAVNISEPLVPESAPLDEFGEFEAYSSPSRDTTRGDLTLRDSPPGLRKSSSDPLKVWSSCLSKCSEVLESCVSVFSEVKDQSVLEEIAQSEEGRNKLKGIVEVYRLAKRVYRPFREKKEDAERDLCVQSIQKQWKTMVNALPNNIMTQLYADTTPACVEQEDVLSDSISKCSLCVSSKTISIPPHHSLDGRKEDYTMPLLFHGGQSYHPSCANFWFNVVQEELPTLT